VSRTDEFLVELLKSNGFTIDRTRPAQHRRPRAAETVLANPTPIDGLIATLRMAGASDVQRERRAPADDCQHCDPQPARPADVEVYTRTATGERGHDVMCQACAPSYVATAAGWISVEVLVP